MRISILGAGSFGTTIASLLAPRHPTVLWARSPEVVDEINTEHSHERYLAGFRLPERLRATEDFDDAVRSAEVLVMAVPSQVFRQVLVQLATVVHPGIPVVSLTKGLEAGSHLRMTELIEEVLPGHPAAAMTGPNLAREIMAGNASATVIASRDRTVAALLQKVFRTGSFRVYANHDVVGCELGGALKNVIAIGAGMAQGLGVGDNTRAAVMTRGLAELTRLGVAMGGESATFAGLTGLGDLIATCMSPHSRNRHVGEQLGRGRSLDEIVAEMSMVAEGVTTAGSMMELGERFGVHLPICRDVNEVIHGRARGRDVYRGLLPAGHEADPG